MNESNLNEVVYELNAYFLKKYGNVSFSFWLSGDVYFEHNCNTLIFAASTTKLAYGLFFVKELEKNKIKLDEELNIIWDISTLQNLYRKIIKKEKVDPYIDKIYKLLNVNEKIFLNTELEKDKENTINIATAEYISNNLHKKIYFKTLLNLIFSKSSNKALDLLVNHYKNHNIILQDEVQKLVDNILGKDCLTVINNSYKEKEKNLWNVSTLKELIDIFSIFLNKNEQHTFFKKYLNIVSNKYIEWNTIYEPILFEKSGWYPNYPITENLYKQDLLFKTLNLDKYKYATFINCVSYNPNKNRFIGYALCIGHDKKIGKRIIKSEGPTLLNRLIEFI